ARAPTMLHPCTALTTAEPYPCDADLGRERPLDWHDGFRLWVAASAEAVTAVLREPGLRVRPPAEPVPPGIVGTPAGEVFGRLVRMTDGPVQQRYKQVVLAALGQPSTDQITALATEHTKHSGTAPLREL